MRRGLVELRARIPEELYDEFIKHFPGTDGGVQYGAISWFIKNALQAFNEQMKNEPGLRQQITKSIVKMVEENKAA